MNNDVFMEISGLTITEEEVQEAMDRFWTAMEKEEAGKVSHVFLDKKLNIKED